MSLTPSLKSHLLPKVKIFFIYCFVKIINVWFFSKTRYAICFKNIDEKYTFNVPQFLNKKYVGKNFHKLKKNSYLNRFAQLELCIHILSSKLSVKHSKISVRYSKWEKWIISKKMQTLNSLVSQTIELF